MKLSKKLLAGSMALMLSLGNLHAMEGQNPPNLGNETTPNATQNLRSRYQFYVSHQEAYDLWRNGLINNPYANIRMLRKNNRNFVMHREHNTSSDLLDFVHKIEYDFEVIGQSGNMSQSEKRSVDFIRDMLRANKILDDEYLLDEDWLIEDIELVSESIYAPRYNNEIYFKLFDPNYKNDSECDSDDFCVVYGQQLFLLPLEIDTRRICVAELKNMLSHLLTNIGVLTILLSNTDTDKDSVHCFHLTGLDVESGFCTCVGNDGIEYPTHINTLAKTLEDSQIPFLNICYLDKIPKRNRLLVKYSDGEDLFWDSSL